MNHPHVSSNRLHPTGLLNHGVALGVDQCRIGVGVGTCHVGVNPIPLILTRFALVMLTLHKDAYAEAIHVWTQRILPAATATL